VPVKTGTYNSACEAPRLAGGQRAQVASQHREESKTARARGREQASSRRGSLGNTLEREQRGCTALHHVLRVPG
jgi:hypothetical protein